MVFVKYTWLCGNIIDGAEWRFGLSVAGQARYRMEACGSCVPCRMHPYDQECRRSLAEVLGV